jgi:hypothetical protein
MTFQFTKSWLDESSGEAEIRYAKEHLITLDKSTGKVSCSDAALQRAAQAELDKAIETRTASDITRLVQKSFESQADLWPIRDQGGAYMVPDAHAGFTTKISDFLTRLGGWIRRLPIPSGTPHGDAAVQTIAFEGMDSLIAEYEAAVADFGTSTRASTLEAAADRIKVSRVKVEAYAHMLGEKRGELMNHLDEAAAALKARVASIGAAKKASDDDCHVSCDHCHAPNVVSEDATACVCVECHKEFPCE